LLCTSFGKFIMLQFGWRGQLVGANIQTYLLEKVCDDAVRRSGCSPPAPPRIAAA
jgi:hypothetical protein